MTEKNPAVFLQAGSHPAEDVRRFIAATAYSPGIVGFGDLKVSQNSTPNMTVSVASGRAFIAGSQSTYQGTYFVENRGATSLTITAANATNPRKDLIVAQVEDAAYSGAVNAWKLAVVTGTAAASPVEPSAPANSIVLAMVDVPANDTAITDSQITDRRVYGGRQWSEPWGRVGHASDTSEAFAVTTETAFGSLSTTFTATANRLYLATATVANYSNDSSNTGGMTYRIKSGATVLGAVDNISNLINLGQAITFTSAPFTLTAGTQTIGVTAQKFGSGTQLITANPTSAVSVLVVEDIGPSSVG